MARSVPARERLDTEQRDVTQVDAKPEPKREVSKDAKADYKAALETFNQNDKSGWNESACRVGIVGAGYTGAVLARELGVKRNLGLRPIVFFDDNPQKWQTRVHDIPVVGAPECLLQHRK